MSISLVSSGVASNSSAVSSLTITSVAVSANWGQTMIVTTSVRGTTAVSSVTWNGKNFTLLLAQNGQSGYDRCELWYLKDPPPGTSDLVVNWASSCCCIFGYAVYKNVNLIDGPFRTGCTIGGTGYGTTAGITITGGLTNDLAICAGTYADQGGNYTPACTSGTMVYEQWWTGNPFSDRSWTLHSYIAGGSSVSLNWSSTSNISMWGFVGASLVPLDQQRPYRMMYYRRRHEPGLISKLEWIEP